MILRVRNRVFFYQKMLLKSKIRSFYRRMTYSPCGSLLIVPGG